MFEDSLIESVGKLKTKRGKTATVSFLLQLTLLSIFVFLPLLPPLLFTETLTKQQLMTPLATPSPLPEPGLPPVLPWKVQTGIFYVAVLQPATTHVRISESLIQGLLIRKVPPTYPSLARSAPIQGKVVLRALISKEGTIENMQIISGHPMLIQSAIDAVKQWKYRPYILNGAPVAVDTQVTVIFTLVG